MLSSGEYFVVKDERDPDIEHFIQFSMSLRGKPAIMVDNIRFIVMNENVKRVLWRCSMMSTKTRKCPARMTMYKGNPPKFVLGQCRHEHMELIRGNYKSSVSGLNMDEVKPDYFIPGPLE